MVSLFSAHFYIVFTHKSDNYMGFDTWHIWSCHFLSIAKENLLYLLFSTSLKFFKMLLVQFNMIHCPPSFPKMFSCSLGNHLLNTKMLSNFILQNAIFENVDNICFEQNCIGMMVLSSFFYSCFIFTYTSFNSYSTGAITNFPSLRKQGSF